MSLTRNLGQYEDVRQVLELALANNGGIYTLDSVKATYRWRQRAYMYRKLLREEMIAKRETLGFSTVTPYDRLLLTLSGESVLITIAAPTGTFEAFSGPTKPAEVNSTDVDLSEAEKLLRELSP